MLTVGSRWASSKVGLRSTNFATYKELQVHGDVVLARDVAELVIVLKGSEPLPDARAFAARWTAKFGVRVSFVDAQTGSACG